MCVARGDKFAEVFTGGRGTLKGGCSSSSSVLYAGPVYNVIGLCAEAISLARVYIL